MGRTDAAFGSRRENILQGNRILVTGGAGYVGSHCCKAIAAAGFEPVVFDNLSTGQRSLVRWGPFVEGDVRDRDRLVSAFSEFEPVAVMHLAAVAVAGQSLVDPDLYYDVNVVGTLRVLQAMHDKNLKRLIFSSTSAVYGESKRVPLSEDTPCQPINPYGTSKLVCEAMMDDFDRAHGLRAIRLRYFNVGGTGHDCDGGKRQNAETQLIPLVVEAALGVKPEVEIYGSDYPTTDGTAVRDFIHVDDVAAAHLPALRYLLDGGRTETLNLGTGKGASVAEVVATAESVAGRSIRQRIGARRAGDPAIVVADPRKASALLGWQANAGLKDIIESEWNRYVAATEAMG